MIDGKTDSTAAEAATRWAYEEAMANYAIQTQRDAIVSAQLKIVDMETGEMNYVDLPATSSETEAAVVVPSRPYPMPPVDAETAYRRARLGVVAAIVLLLLLLWIRERRK